MSASRLSLAALACAAILASCSESNGNVAQPIPPAAVNSNRGSAVALQPAAAGKTDVRPLMLTGASLERFLLPLRQSHPAFRSLKTYQAPITFTRLDVPGMPGFIYGAGGEIVPTHHSDEELIQSGAYPADSNFPCSQTQSVTWVGNAPPACTNSGALRRVYTSPALDALASIVTVPAGGQTLPSNPAMYPTGDIAYVYLEGWPGKNSDNSEADLQYSESRTAYNFYAKDGATGGRFGPSNTPFAPGTQYQIIIEANQDSVVDVDGGTTNCSTGCFAFSIVWADPSGQPCPSGKLCAAAGVLHDSAWKWNCCIFARVMSIGQNTSVSNNFEDGSKFGTVSWTGDMTGKYGPLPGYPGYSEIQATNPSFLKAGSQSWPNDSTRILVSGNENDSISLHK